MSTCRWDAEHGYLTRLHWPACKVTDCAGCLPCERDDGGHEIRHCTSRTGCTGHLGPLERLTCSRCVARAKGNLRKLKKLDKEMPDEAVLQRLSHPSVNLAGRAADPRGIAERREYILHHLNLLPRVGLWTMVDGEPEFTESAYDRARADLPDEDEWHAYSVLGRWDMMLREDYGPPTTLKVTVDRAADYLISIVDRLAQDPDQDFPYFAKDIARLSWYYASVLSDSRRRRKGAPCWMCPPGTEENPRPRLVLNYGHWCADEDCDREHAPCAPDCEEIHLDERGELKRHDYGDWWGCPTRREHWWSDADYRKYGEEVRAGKAS